MPNPGSASPVMQIQSHSSSQFSVNSHPSLRYSDTTQGTAHSTLFTTPPPIPPTPTTNGAPVEATDNVLNKVADKDASLFQISLNLRQRLRAIPEFEEQLSALEAEDAQDTDPVTLLWWTFRKGYPLLMIYNTLNPAQPLEVDPSRVTETKRGKAATFKFLQACIHDLKFPAEECFIITDLYGDDTGGFAKVARVVNRVLDILVDEGLIENVTADDDVLALESTKDIKRSQRQHIVEELVKTERTYVQHLELLQAFKKLVEEKGVIPGDAIHDIFLNLNALLDFQRRFLIRVEQTNALPESQQNWGKLFKLYNDAFKVYEPYIANQKRCEEITTREFDKLKEAGGSIEMRQMVETPAILSSFLMKPFQRLAKYPLLLKELRDKGGLDQARKEDITIGIEAASSVLERTNAAVDREERLAAVQELKGRVEDWKGHRVEAFGDLLLAGTFTVLKGDNANAKDSEREASSLITCVYRSHFTGCAHRSWANIKSGKQYKVYLFESILLCCKEMNPNKQKNKLMNKPVVDRKGKPKLQLKGRIFMQNVTETISYAKPGSYTCQIFWKGDPGIENFVIKFSTEELMKKWALQVDNQRRVWIERPRGSDGRSYGTSETEFTFMQNQGALENPYRNDDDEGEDEDDVSTVYGQQPRSEFPMDSRSGSRTSLRSRSTTGDSGQQSSSSQSAVRVPPPRFPMNISAPPLTLRTQQLANAAPSPGDRGGDSYFSPSIESPVSIRTSSSSGMFPFPRQQPPTSAYHGEDSNRFTAPAIGRTVSRDGQGMNGYPSNGRSAMRPSAPPGIGSQNAQTLQNRFRSASSPNIQNPLPANRATANNYASPVPDVPVPPFPVHYAHHAGINRSQSNSPTGASVGRVPSQSPGAQRDRSFQPRHPQELHYPEYEDSSAQPNGRPVAYPRSTTQPPPVQDSRPLSPRSDDYPPPSPTQLKVKVHCESAGCTYTLVVAINISYQSLKDRIDAKLQRSTNLSLSSGQLKLKYLDEDDYVSIQSDEDVQIAFETWKEQHMDQIVAGQLGEIELYCQ
ncbi:MAG: hypothetical protein M1821_006164 [Bathelium mastoideum]|nr:MAG: hypothetical protein M1821_006164 [Bathelium mastoideum]KAI9686503.1 MAG: hypothetical protein M1822_003514 [Bathelium mastoideum]